MTDWPGHRSRKFVECDDVPLSHRLRWSGHPAAAEARVLVREWLARVPRDELNETLTRLDSAKDLVHTGAFAELATDAMLRLRADSVERHVRAPNGRKMDFVAACDLSQVEVEVAVSGAMSDEDHAAETLRDQLWRRVVDWRLGDASIIVEIRARPTRKESLRGVEQRVREWVDRGPSADVGLADDLVIAIDGGSIRCRRTTVSAAERQSGRYDGPPMISSGDPIHAIKAVTNEKTLARVVSEKAGRYGETDRPRVLVLGLTASSMHLKWPEDVFAACYGHNRLGRYRRIAGVGIVDSWRLRDRAHGAYSHKRAKWLSGVLAVFDIGFVKLHEAEAYWLPNPNAEFEAPDWLVDGFTRLTLADDGYDLVSDGPATRFAEACGWSSPSTST